MKLICVTCMLMSSTEMETPKRRVVMGPRHKREPIDEIFYALDSVSPKQVHKNFGKETLEARKLKDWGWLCDGKDVQTVWDEMSDHDLTKSPSYVPCTPIDQRGKYAMYACNEGVEVNSAYNTLPNGNMGVGSVGPEMSEDVSHEVPNAYVYRSDISRQLLNKFFPFPK